MMDSQASKSAKETLANDYFQSLLIMIPIVLSFLIDKYFVSEMFRITTLEYSIVSFVVSSIFMFYAYSITLKVIRYDAIDGEVFANVKGLINYLILGLVMFFGMQLLGNYFGTELFDIAFNLVEPFGDFLGRANSMFGFAIRFILVIDFMVLVIGLIMFILLHKFFMTPFLIIDGDNVIEALQGSWEQTTDNGIEIVRVMMFLLVKFLIIFDVFILVVFLFASTNPQSLDSPFLEYVFLGVLVLYYLPSMYLTLGHLYEEM